jgi:hypothetical protein
VFVSKGPVGLKYVRRYNKTKNKEIIVSTNMVYLRKTGVKDFCYKLIRLHNWYVDFELPHSLL